MWKPHWTLWNTLENSIWSHDCPIFPVWIEPIYAEDIYHRLVTKAICWIDMYVHACFEWRKSRVSCILWDTLMSANSNQSANRAFESIQRIQFRSGRKLKRTSTLIERVIPGTSNTYAKFYRTIISELLRCKIKSQCFCQ